MDELTRKIQSTKLLLAFVVFASATSLLVFQFIPAPVWESIAQTTLIGYALADVAAKWAPK